MSNSIPDNADGFTFQDAARVIALDSKVSALDSDVRQINDRIGSLETKFDTAANSMAREFRSGLAAITQQINDGGSTQWGVIFTGMGVALTVLGMIGALVWYPVSSGLADLKGNIVPRAEHDRFYKDYERRMDGIEHRLSRNEDRLYDEMVKAIERLRTEKIDGERKLFDLQQRGAK